LSKQQAALVKSEAVIRLRQKSSLLKVEDSIELCLELLDNGRQVAISCEFLATMDAMEEALRKKKISYARVDGRYTNNSHLKEAERLRYQRGDAPVILFNVVEGISLHEGEANNGGNNVPRSQIDHDLRWFKSWIAWGQSVRFKYRATPSPIGTRSEGTIARHFGSGSNYAGTRPVVCRERPGSRFGPLAQSASKQRHRAFCIRDKSRV
jgi:hypothetical protein